MPLSTSCPKCQARYQMPDGSQGKKAKCKKCGNVFTVAGGPPAPKAAPKSNLPDWMDAAAPASAPAASIEKPAKSKGKLLVAVALILLLAGGGVAAWLTLGANTARTSPSEVALTSAKIDPLTEAIQDAVKQVPKVEDGKIDLSKIDPSKIDSSKIAKAITNPEQLDPRLKDLDKAFDKVKLPGDDEKLPTKPLPKEKAILKDVKLALKLHVTADGKTLIAGQTGQLRQWDLETLQEKPLPIPLSSEFVVAFSPDNKSVAVGSGFGQNQPVKFYDLETGKLTAEWKDLGKDLPIGSVRSLAFSPDGKRLIVHHFRFLTLWDVATGTMLARRDNVAEAAQGLHAQSATFITPDGKILVTVRANGAQRPIRSEVHLYNAETLEPLNSTKDLPGPVEGIDLTPDGRLLALGTGVLEDAQVILVEIPSGKLLQSFKVDSNAVKIRFSADGKLLAAGVDNTLRLFEMPSAKPLGGFYVPGFLKHTTSLAFTPDGKTVIGGYIGDDIKLWDVATASMELPVKGKLPVAKVDLSPETKTKPEVSLKPGTPRERAVLKGQDSVECLVLTPDGKGVIAGQTGGAISVWDLDSRTERHSWKTGAEGWVMRLALTPDGKSLASISGKGAVKVWDPESGKETASLMHGGIGTCVALSPDGKQVASAGQSFTLWDIASRKQVWHKPAEKGFNLKGAGHVCHLEFSPDGKTVTTGGSFVKVWDRADGKELEGSPLFGNANRLVLPDAKTAVFAFGSKELHVRSRETGKNRYLLAGHTDAVESVALSPDGKVLASGDKKGEVRLWEYPSGKLYAVLKAHSRDVRELLFSKDGKVLYSGSWDNTIKIFDLPDQFVVLAEGPKIEPEMPATTPPTPTPAGALKQRAALKSTFDAPAQSLAQSPDGRFLVTMHGFGVVLWDLTTQQGKQLPEASAARMIGARFASDSKTIITFNGAALAWDAPAYNQSRRLVNGSVVSTLAYSPDNKLVATASGTFLRLRDAATWNEIADPESKRVFVHGLYFTADGKTLVACMDKMIRTWTVPATPVQTIDHGDPLIKELAVTPDGRNAYFASGQKVSVADLVEGKFGPVIPAHPGEVTTLAIHPDGKRLFTGDKLGTIRIWDVASGKLLSTTTAHAKPVTILQFTPDGKTLYSAGDFDRTRLIKLWEVPQ